MLGSFSALKLSSDSPNFPSTVLPRSFSWPAFNNTLSRMQDAKPVHCDIPLSYGCGAVHVSVTRCDSHPVALAFSAQILYRERLECTDVLMENGCGQE